MIVILGAGLAGMSCSYHLRHNCLVVEKNNYSGGHIYSQMIDGFTWDEGPHVSFTKHQYVKDLFALSVSDEFLEYPVYPTNYFKGYWVKHPAQSNLYAVPEPIRSKCLSDFLRSRNNIEEDCLPSNYDQWSKLAFGDEFSNQFITAYTRKYWTLDPIDLSTAWVGNRVFYPDVETVKKGFEGPLDESTHYITSVRYPNKGGYNSYSEVLSKGMNVQYNKQVVKVDLESKAVYFADGTKQNYTTLVNTLPLPEFVRLLNANEGINKAAEQLVCTELLLLNFVVSHPATVDSHWVYVYDEDKYSTRINFTELLSPNNGISGKCGIQVEVYFSKFRRQKETVESIRNKVATELIEMGLIKHENAIEVVRSKKIKYANVVFDHQREASMEIILDYLTSFGLVRENDDLAPSTDWGEKELSANVPKLGDLILAGRFGQWKYYWTDDCVLRGRHIAENIS